MKARTVAIIVVVVLVFYLVVAGSQAISLIRTGQPVAAAMGIGLLVLPLVAIYLVWREFQFGFRVQEMARVLEAEQGLPVDDLPRTPGGAVDREAADAQFEIHKVETQEDPTDWRAWYRLAASYDASGDRKRARAAMRYAYEMYAPTKSKSKSNNAKS